MNLVLRGAVLGIESSCDETAAAVLDAGGSVLSERVYSQMEEHGAFGGVVPEIAARAHLGRLGLLVGEVLAEAGVEFGALGGIAATAGPGLIGGLLVGTGFAKGAALAAGVPYMAINHLEAHALTARLPGVADGGVAFPYLLLLVSGGHCQLVAVERVGVYRRLGGTLDDAVGEAFDKTAKLLGLGYPGGPAVEILARDGVARFELPRPMVGREGCDFSFSGLKTAVAQLVVGYGDGALPRQVAADVAASFQTAVGDVFVDRVGRALRLMPEASAVVAAGGVAANILLRERLLGLVTERGMRFVAPPLPLCGDNAVMVAWAGIERLRLGMASGLDAACRPRWPL